MLMQCYKRGYQKQRMINLKQFEVTSESLHPEQYREWTLNENQGAVVVFTGHVREWTKGIRTEHLEYEAYVPMAEKKTSANW